MMQITFRKLALFVCLLCMALLITITSFAQGYIGGEATNHGLGINAGYVLNKIQLQSGFHGPIVSDPHKFYAGYVSGGYQIALNPQKDISLTPSLGIAIFGTDDFSEYDGGVPVSKIVLLPSLEVGKYIMAISGIKVRFYLFVDHAVKTFYGTGLKFFIIKMKNHK